MFEISDFKLGQKSKFEVTFNLLVGVACVRLTTVPGKPAVSNEFFVIGVKHYRNRTYRNR